MIKIAICDDEKNQLELIRGYIASYQNSHQDIDLAVTTFASSFDLLSHVEGDGGFDLYFLDVFMSGYKGTDTARQLRQQGDKGELVFITSSRDHALEAYNLEASQYLVKPVKEADFFKVLDKIVVRLRLERRRFITLRTTTGMIRLYTRNVVFTESGRKNYQTIHLLDKEKIEVRMTSAELFELLSPNRFFVRCGASMNLNMKYVRQVTRDKIFFDTGEQISYPYRAYQMLKEQFLSLHLDKES